MSNKITIQLCPHKTNPAACPICYRLKPPEKKIVEVPGIKPGIAVGYVMPIGEATMRATQHAQAAMPTPQASGGKAFREPYRSGNRVPPPEAFDKDKLWKPKGSSEQLIDKLPTHPHATEGRAQVLKA